MHNDDECPVDQPHHKWDQRCKALETSDTEVIIKLSFDVLNLLLASLIDRQKSST